MSLKSRWITKAAVKLQIFDVKLKMRQASTTRLEKLAPKQKRLVAEIYAIRMNCIEKNTNINNYVAG